MATKEKYDRQLRLWGSNGQKALSNTRIILFSATTVGTETLKNLVLPGIGSFHIIDEESAMVEPATDASQCANFFALPTTSEGVKHRAEIACKLLLELNEDVKGSYQTVPSSFASPDGIDFVKLITEEGGGDDATSSNILVIAADLPLPSLLPLSKACWDKSVPLISVKSYGFIGTCRVQTNHHFIIESKPDSSVPDLRLANDVPFSDLLTLLQEYDLDSMHDMDHGHVPYVVILYKAMEKYKAQNEGKAPSTFAEKEEFKKGIKEMSRNYDMEVNFQEAYKDAYLAYAKRDLPFEVTSILESYTSDTEVVIKTSFDVMVMALNKFLQQNNNQPPLDGSIPDMTASTDMYIKLQMVYKNKADDDFNSMRNLVNDITSSDNNNNVEVSDEELAIFCKNIYNLQLLQTRSIAMEMESQTSNNNRDAADAMDVEDPIRDDLIMACMDPSDPPTQTPLLWYIALRAAELFQSNHGVYPGSDDRELAMQSDIDEVYKIMQSIVGADSLKLEDADLIRDSLKKEEHAAEIVRYYNAELHNTASVIGGVGSQEAVKLITHQYVPLDNTFVFNGIASIAAVYQF